MKRNTTINVEMNNVLSDAVANIAIKNNQSMGQCITYILEQYVNEHFFGVDKKLKVCPHCLTVAEKYEDIEVIFGWRTINNKTIPQSYCRKCRSKGIEEKKVEQAVSTCTNK